MWISVEDLDIEAIGSDEEDECTVSASTKGPTLSFLQHAIRSRKQDWNDTNIVWGPQGGNFRHASLLKLKLKVKLTYRLFSEDFNAKILKNNLKVKIFIFSLII